MVEVVVDGRVDRDEFLQTSHLPEPQHGAFSSPEGEMRVFGPVVCPPRGFLSIFVSNHFHSRALGGQSIGNDHFWIAISLHRFLQNRKRSLAIPPIGGETLQDFTFMIYGALKVMLLAVDFDEDLIECHLHWGLWRKL